MDPILVGKSVTTPEGGQVCLDPKYGNRHGLVAGATGTGKTVTLMTLAEGFSRIGVPVFMADVKGDVAGLAVAGTPNEQAASQRVAADRRRRTTRPKRTPSSSGTCTASSAIRCARPSARSARPCSRASSSSTTRRRACSRSCSSSPTTAACCCSTWTTCARCSPRRRQPQGHLARRTAWSARSRSRAIQRALLRLEQDGRRPVLRRAGAGTGRPDAHDDLTAAASSASSPPTS